jgi:hypothetical protein
VFMPNIFRLDLVSSLLGVPHALMQADYLSFQDVDWLFLLSLLAYPLQ